MTTPSPDTIKARLARTCTHPSYDDPYDAVLDYQRVQTIAADNPDKGAAAIATIVELPRSRIRPWLDGGMPDPVRAIATA